MFRQPARWWALEHYGWIAAAAAWADDEEEEGLVRPYVRPRDPLLKRGEQKQQQLQISHIAQLSMHSYTPASFISRTKQPYSVVLTASWARLGSDHLSNCWTLVGKCVFGSRILFLSFSLSFFPKKFCSFMMRRFGAKNYVFLRITSLVSFFPRH